MIITFQKKIMLNQISGLVGKHQIGFTQTQSELMLIGLTKL